MSTQTLATTITIGPVRVSYHNLLKPRSQNGNAEEKKYGATFLIPKSIPAIKQSIDSAIEAAIRDGLNTKWNGSAPPQPPIPLSDGDGVRPNGDRYSPECYSNYVMSAKSKDKPEIVNMQLQPIINESEIYNGMYVYASVSFFSYARSGKKGIGCSLNAVMKYKDGDPLGRRITAASAFASILNQNDWGEKNV